MRPTANLLDIVQYIELHPLISTKAFWIKLFKNFEEQVGVTGDSLAKKNSAFQLKSNQAIKPKYFNVWNVRVIP